MIAIPFPARIVRALGWAVLLSAISEPLHAESPAPKLLYAFQTQPSPDAMQARGTELSLTDQVAKSLRVIFQPVAWPNVQFVPPKNSSWDWTGFDAIAVDVTNPGSEPITFSVRVDDTPNSMGTDKDSRSGTVTIDAGATGTFYMNFSASDAMKTYGMRAGPPETLIPGAREFAGSGTIDSSHIAAFQIFMHAPTTPQILTIGNIRLFPTRSLADVYGGLVDSFGQYARADWPGKVHDVKDFSKRVADEHKSLSTAIPDRDLYGGWASGPTATPTGFFTTRQVDGRWWLVDPVGKLFLSFGPCACDYQAINTVITGRDSMFTWLPDAGDPFARFYSNFKDIHSGPVSSGRAFSFYEANLSRKFGRAFEEAWRDETVSRLRAWGFNTLGNWPDQGLLKRHKIAYTATLGIYGDHSRVSGGWDYWAKMHDPFDPRFATDADESLKRQAMATKDDPWCLGYFVDNELSWAGGDGPEEGRYGLAYGTLISPANQPAKQAMLKHLQSKYGSIEKLNVSWETKLASWDALAAPFEATRKPNDAMKQDFSAFISTFSRKYFTVVRDTLHKYDPHHLYLGCRFAAHNMDSVRAAAEVCDVVSFNIYERGVGSAKWDYTKSLGKPCIVGEFHFGALDHGMFHGGLVPTASQSERAAAYRDYVQSIIDHPAFVGCHWFQYIDEPVTGRTYDGENYNIGFVDVTDTPYPEMVDAATKVHVDMYARRAKR